jgi:hypothetical protein
MLLIYIGGSPPGSSLLYEWRTIDTSLAQVGATFDHPLNRNYCCVRMSTSDDRARETIQISPATALRNLVPHLASTDSRIREAALIAVDSLGHKDFFLQLAKALVERPRLARLRKRCFWDWTQPTVTIGRLNLP